MLLVRSTLLVAMLAASLALDPVHAAAQDMAITHVTVVDVTEGALLGDMTVLVSDGRITDVAPAAGTSLPAGAVEVAGRGRYLIPGLWDMHVHSSTDEITREVVYPLFVAHGVTGVRNMSGGCLMNCRAGTPTIEMTLRRRRDVAEGRLVGPRVVTAGPIIRGAPPGAVSTVLAPATEEHGRELARLHAARGVDLIKVYDELPAPAFRGLTAEAAQLGLPVVGHVPWEVGSLAAAESGMRSIEHLYAVIDDCSATSDAQREAVVAAYQAGDGAAVFRNLFTSLERFSVETCAALYAELSKHDVWQVPTLVAGGGAFSGVEWRHHPGRRFLPRTEVEYWLTQQAGESSVIPGGLGAWALVQARVELITLDMFRAGVPVLAGSDALAVGVYPGFGLHEELEQLVQAGFTPLETLRAATLEPARFLEATDSLGSVAAGKVADLVLLDGNPLDDIRNTRRIRAVIARGRLFERADLDRLLEGAAAAAAR